MCICKPKALFYQQKKERFDVLTTKELQPKKRKEEQQIKEPF